MKGILKRFLKLFGIPIEWIRYYWMMVSFMWNGSNTFSKKNRTERIVLRIQILSHELDKGFSFAFPRKGFGKEKAKELYASLLEYQEIKDRKYYSSFLDGYEILKYYVDHKQEYGFDTSGIDISRISLDNGSCTDRISVRSRTGKDAKMMDFKELAYNRHSIRSFSEEPIPQEMIYNAVRIARSSPSACNRQSARVLYVGDPGIVNGILDIQSGATGFYNCKQILIMGADLRKYQYVGEMNTAYVDASLFMMSLIYAFQYMGIGTCPLIWDDFSNKRSRLSEFVKIPKYILIVGIIAIGFPQEDDKVAFSPRQDTEDYIILLDGTTK